MRRTRFARPTRGAGERQKSGRLRGIGPVGCSASRGFERWAMARWRILSMHVLLLLLALAVMGSTGIAQAEPEKTLKERLSDKASDDQRVDNCRVAPERRGPKARPDCPEGAPARRPRSEPATAR